MGLKGSDVPNLSHIGEKNPQFTHSWPLKSVLNIAGRDYYESLAFIIVMISVFAMMVFRWTGLWWLMNNVLTAAKVISKTLEGVEEIKEWVFI